MKNHCRTGKEAWPDREAAEETLKRVIGIHQQFVDPVRDVPGRVYECPFCFQWHLTHKPYAKKARRR